MVSDQPVSWHALDHTIRPESDEPGIAVDRVTDAFFAWHFSFLPLSSFYSGGAKAVGTVVANGWAGATHGSLCEPKDRKVGSLPPIRVFLPRPHSSPLFAPFPCFRMA